MSLSSLSLDAFYSCAQIGHFTKAAERLNITQSALSQRIKNLEEELGLTLFIRERSGLRLTEAGQKLLRYCQTRDSLEQETLVEMKSQAVGSLRGELRIGGYSSVVRSILMPSLKSILKTTGLALKLVTKEMSELPATLQSGETDFLVLDHVWKKEGIAHLILGHEKNVLIQKKNYKGADVYLDHDEEDLTTIRFLKRKNIQRLFLDDIYGIIDGVRMGLGKGVVPLHLVHHYSDIEILDEKKSAENPVVLHYYEQSFYTKLHEEVRQVLQLEATQFLQF